MFVLCEVRLDHPITSIINVYTFKKTTVQRQKPLLVTQRRKNEQRVFLNTYDLLQVQRMSKHKKFQD